MFVSTPTNSVFELMGCSLIQHCLHQSFTVVVVVGFGTMSMGNRGGVELDKEIFFINLRFFLLFF
jgi:hypothetical protein